eukprot:3269723-Prymnesium_polylepis.1
MPWDRDRGRDMYMGHGHGHGHGTWTWVMDMDMGQGQGHNKRGNIRHGECGETVACAFPPPARTREGKRAGTTATAATTATAMATGEGLRERATKGEGD